MKPRSLFISEGSADGVDCHGYNRVIHGGRGVGGVVMKGIVSLSGYSGNGAFYALKFPPLIIKSLGVFNPSVHVGWHIQEPINLFEDFRVYGSPEVVNCGFDIESTFCCHDHKVHNKVICCFLSHSHGK